MSRSLESPAEDLKFLQRLSSLASPGVAAEHKVADAYFMREVGRLKVLRSFLIKEAISLGPHDAATRSSGGLNVLKFDAAGRQPTKEEWDEVETQTQAMFQLMNEPVRRRFLLGQIPSIISYLPILFGAIALVALIYSILRQGDTGLHPEQLGSAILPFYLAWLVSLGAMGAVAFIGMNALSLQQDATFDIGNTRLMTLRISLGALFGLVLALPFGFSAFLQFVHQMYVGGNDKVDAGTVVIQAMLLLLPFILGFSTSLVILVLNRLVDAVQTFFGMPPTSQARSARTDPGTNRPPPFSEGPH